MRLSIMHVDVMTAPPALSPCDVGAEWGLDLCLRLKLVSRLCSVHRVGLVSTVELPPELQVSAYVCSGPASSVVGTATWLTFVTQFAVSFRKNIGVQNGDTL